MDYHHFHGKNIPHIEANPDMKIADLVEIYTTNQIRTGWKIIES